MEDMIKALLYQLNMKHYYLSVIACFYIGDNRNEQTLLELKEKIDIISYAESHLRMSC